MIARGHSNVLAKVRAGPLMLFAMVLSANALIRFVEHQLRDGRIVIQQRKQEQELDVDAVIDIMRTIETQLHGLETTLVYYLESPGTDGQVAKSQHTSATWRIDRGQVAATAMETDDPLQRIRMRWWTGESFQTFAVTPDPVDLGLSPPRESLRVSWHFHAGMPNHPAMFNQCAGYHNGARLGLPFAVRYADNVSVNEDADGNIIIRYAVGDNLRYTLGLATEPHPRYVSWKREGRQQHGAEWHVTGEYRVEKWIQVGDWTLPKRATCTYRLPKSDGTIARATHVYERQGAEFFLDREVIEGWFETPHERGTYVTNSMSGVQWEVGSPLLFVDERFFNVGEEIWSDPSPRLAELLSTAAEFPESEGSTAADGE